MTLGISIDLSDRTALVTGAAGGLGRAISLGLAAAGADVVLADIRTGAPLSGLRDEIAAMGRTARVADCDISDSGEVRGMFESLRADADRPPSILVNNAGYYRDYAPIHSVDDAMIDRTVDINLKGLLYMSREFSSWMRDIDGTGTIINISSGAAHGGRAGHAHYSASKAGVLAATRAMAIDLSPAITVNSISVGFVDVGMFDDESLIAVKRDILPRIPLGAGRPEDISMLVCYLASPFARWMTATDIRVDGGESAGRIPFLRDNEELEP
ncbi:MAG: SDR family NAD(P)-dependent oxidoreductase [Microbacterium sp.]